MSSRYFNRLGETIIDIFKDSVKGIFKPVDESCSPQSVDVVFDDFHMDIDIHGKPYGAPRPMAWVKEGFINPVYGDKIEIENKEYTIVEVKLQEQVTELVLQEA